MPRSAWEFHDEACMFLDKYVESDDIRKALMAYLDYVIQRTR